MSSTQTSLKKDSALVLQPQDLDLSYKALPNSQKVYVEGKAPGVKVPFREISQSSSRDMFGKEVSNPNIRVYDTSGPYSDPLIKINIGFTASGFGFKL
jgi:hypothetical protein